MVLNVVLTILIQFAVDQILEFVEFNVHDTIYLYFIHTKHNTANYCRPHIKK